MKYVCSKFFNNKFKNIFQKRNIISSRKYKFKAGMKTTNTYMGSAATLKHISGTKTETSVSDKNEDNTSGHGNTSCIFIFIKDKFVSGLNAIIKTFTEYSFKFNAGRSKLSRMSFFKGREMNMRTGNSSGSFRISTCSSGKISLFFRRISDVLISCSKSVRVFTNPLRNISLVGISYPDIHGNYFQPVRENCGIFFQLPESLKVYSILMADTSRSFKFLYYLFRCFPGLFRSLPAGSGDEQKTIKNQIY